MHFFTAIQLFLFPSHRLISQPPVTLSSGYAVVGDEMPSGWERACHPNVGMYYINNTASKLLFLSKFFTFLTVYWYGTSSRSIHFCMHLRNESRTRFPRKMEKYTRGNAQGLSKNSAGGSRCKFGVSYLVIDRLIDWLIDSLILCRLIDWLIEGLFAWTHCIFGDGIRFFLQAKREIYDVKDRRLRLAEEDYDHLNQRLDNFGGSKQSREWGVTFPLLLRILVIICPAGQCIFFIIFSLPF